jgi:BirA family biotin operon repressor/biotin-[acetyl-CoA-carboxylase] ligase
LRIIYKKSLESTQSYLLQSLKNNTLNTPIAIVALSQTNGKGSRNNSWEGKDGNLFLSFSVDIKTLPKDIPLNAYALYFAMIILETLQDMGSKIWLKWPNDFYVDNKKIGGLMTNRFEDSLICGVGLNIVNAPELFGILDIDIDKEELLKKIFLYLKTKPKWKKLFSNYKLQWQRTKLFLSHHNNEIIDLKNAQLQDDGTLVVNGKQIMGLR